MNCVVFYNNYTVCHCTRSLAQITRTLSEKDAIAMAVGRLYQPTSYQIWCGLTGWLFSLIDWLIVQFDWLVDCSVDWLISIYIFGCNIILNARRLCFVPQRLCLSKTLTSKTCPSKTCPSKTLSLEDLSLEDFDLEDLSLEDLSSKTCRIIVSVTDLWKSLTSCKRYKEHQPYPHSKRNQRQKFREICTTRRLQVLWVLLLWVNLLLASRQRFI